MTLSAYNPITGQFAENDATKPLDNSDLQQWMDDNLAAALPAGAGKLLGASVAGTAVAITLSSSFTLTGGVLGVVGGSGGSYTATTPIAVSGNVISLAQSNATAGQVLAWSGAAWVPTTISSNGQAYTAGTGLTLTGVQFALGVVPLANIAQGGATSGQAMVWNGSVWAPGTVSGGGSGASPATTVPLADAGTGSVGTSTLYARADHVHPAPPAAAITVVTIDGSTIPGSTGTPYQMLTGDRVIDVNKGAGAATVIKLPVSPTFGAKYDVIDGKGDAGTNNITVSGGSGVTINGASSLVINANYVARTLLAVNATTWRIA